MKTGQADNGTRLQTNSDSKLKQKWRHYLRRVKDLQGDPHYVAMGMAVGVFIGVTPTFPFHTVLAVGLAFLLRGSKPAAAVGVWVGNPFTMPFFYYLSYQIGNSMLSQPSPFDLKYESILELLNLGWAVVAAMLIGGAIIGLPPAIAAYFITRSAFVKISRRRAGRAATKPIARSVTEDPP